MDVLHGEEGVCSLISYPQEWMPQQVCRKTIIIPKNGVWVCNCCTGISSQRHEVCLELLTVLSSLVNLPATYESR